MESLKSEVTQFTPEEQANNARLLAALPSRSSIPERPRIVDYEIVELAVLLREDHPQKLTAVRVLAAYVSRIMSLNGDYETYGDNGKYNAFVRVENIGPLQQQAILADQWLQNPNDERGPAPPLCGIPFGIKDSIAIEGLESKNGTPHFSTNEATRDATCVAKLRAQVAIIIGHTICSELSGSTIGQFAGNAWDPERVPGGSSQGSGVAPMARLCAAALGEETAGSIIIPAAANGASAIKPSLGVVSGAGVMPLRIGWDVVGPMARSMRDASLILSIISGADGQNDPQSLTAPPLTGELSITPSPEQRPLEGLRIGIPQTDWMWGSPHNTPPYEAYDEDYATAFNRFKTQLAEMGAEVIEFPWLNANDASNTPYTAPQYLYEVKDENCESLRMINAPTITTYCNQLETRFWSAVGEFAESLGEGDAQEFLLRYFSPVEEQIAANIPTHFRLNAENRRREQQQLFEQALDQHKVDFMMVLPLGAHIGKRSATMAMTLPVQRAFFELPNALAWPMVTFPIGHGNTGVPLPLPITAAFWGRRFSEPLLIQAAIDFQNRHSEYHSKAPADPTFGAVKPFHIWTLDEIPPEYSTDPLIILEGRRAKP